MDLVKPEAELQRLREIALSAPGPAPWFLPRSMPVDPKRRPLRWRFSGATGATSYLVLLEDQSTENAVYALAYVAWSLCATDGNLIAYYRQKGFLTIEVHEVSSLVPIRDLQFAKEEAERLHHPVLCDSPPSRVERLDDALTSGTHPAPRLDSCRDEEVLLLAAGPPGDRAKASVYSWRPHEGLVDVYPQEWFNDTLDLGYQWITGVTRDPVTGHVVGHGIRLDPFELDSTNVRLRRSL